MNANTVWQRQTGKTWKIVLGTLLTAFRTDNINRRVVYVVRDHFPVCTRKQIQKLKERFEDLASFLGVSQWLVMTMGGDRETGYSLQVYVDRDLYVKDWAAKHKELIAHGPVDPLRDEPDHIREWIDVLIDMHHDAEPAKDVEDKKKGA